jgi:hypothetical protein
MTGTRIVGWALATALALLVVLALVFGIARRAVEQDADLGAATAPATPAVAVGDSTTRSSESDQGFLYGRVLTEDGTTLEGRLRFGGDEEAFWSDSFNGYKNENSWADHVPPEHLEELRPVEIFGVEITRRERQVELTRPFMARFGDIARIAVQGRDLQVTLKSGDEFHLDRLNADDMADGLRVWDTRRGVVDLAERQVRSIHFLPTAGLSAALARLHGTVRTSQGAFTGFVQWNRWACVGTDELSGRNAEEEVSLRFDAIRSISRNGRDSSLVSLTDGRELTLSGTRDVGRGHRGIHVDDRRYGRVLISWDAFEGVDFSPGASGPAYGDFPPSLPLTGSVTTRGGRRLAGRLVYDLDESLTTETLDAPSQGVDYTIPFGLIASIELPDPQEGGARSARVTLHSGEELRLERSGDLGDQNGGMLVFVDGSVGPEYVPWVEVEQVDFLRSPAMFPALG